MQILVQLGLLFIFCSVLEFYRMALEYFLGSVLMDCVTCLNSYLKHLSANCDFGCGFLVFGSIKQFLKIFPLFLLFGFGLKVLNFSCYCKRLSRFLCDSGGESGPLKNGICAENGFDGSCSSKISTCKCRLLKYVQPVISKFEETEVLNCHADADADVDYKATNVYKEDSNNDSDDSDEDDEGQHYDEDKESDVLALRKLIKIERSSANSALLELEKERMSAATAVEESMAMILRLQNGKSSIQMEANQYRRLAEAKLLYDQEVIRSLQLHVMRHESDRTMLEDQLRLFEQKVKDVLESDGMDQFKEVDESFSSSDANIEDSPDQTLFSLIDLDLSPE